eukprot:3252160-Pyramimonas_sp.AAC.1
MALKGEPAEVDFAVLKSIANDFQAAVKVMDQMHKWPHRHIQRYMGSPSSLPQPVFDFAYEGKVPIDPPNWDSAAYNMMVSRVATRSTNKKIKSSCTAIVPVAPSPAPNSGGLSMGGGANPMEQIAS